MWGGKFIAKKTHLILSSAIIALTVTIKIGGFTIAEQWQNQVFDAYQRLFPRSYTPQPVFIIDIDDESLARTGQWPWPRNTVAKLAEQLHKAGAASVAMDIMFAEADRYSPKQLIESTLKGRKIFQKLPLSLPDYDTMLAKALNDANGVTGFVLSTKPNSSTPLTKAGFAFAGNIPSSHITQFQGAITTLSKIEASASGNGALNSLPDSDGIVRHIPLVYTLNGKLYPSLAAEALRVAQGAGSYVIKASGANGEEDFGSNSGITHIKIGEFDIPTTKAGELWIYYTPPRKTWVIPAWKILQGDFDKALVQGSIIFVGTSAEGLKDLRATPLSPATAGVDIHAQALQQILSGTYLSRPDWVQGAEIMLILAAGLLLIGLMSALPALWGAAYTLAILTGTWGFSFYAFRSHHLLIEPLLPSVAVVLVYFSESLSRYAGTEREKKQIRHAFSHYMSPTLVKTLAAHPERLKLGGEMREMTLLFCDIRGFTTLSEHLDAQELTHMMNRFFTPMTHIILDNQGTIDKYIGDCIMAFWNAPLDDPDHAIHACKAALSMHQALASVNQTLPSPIQIGIGISTGQCCVGNMGSDLRFDYSVIGDTVNLASRLEGQCKTYGANIIIGETTEAELGGHFATLELDKVRVKGKQQPVRIFTVLGDEEFSRSFSFIRLKQDFGKFLEAYRAQSWEQAETLLVSCELQGNRFEHAALAGLFHHYRERITRHKTFTLPANWDGVYETGSK